MRSPTHDLPTHCWPIDAMAKKELRQPDAMLFTSRKPLPKSPVDPKVVAFRNRSFGGSFADLTGQRVGSMEIQHLVMYQEGRRSIWAAQCDCGNWEQRNHRNWIKWHKRGVADACRVCLPMDRRKELIDEYFRQLDLMHLPHSGKRTDSKPEYESTPLDQYTAWMKQHKN